MKSKDNSQFYIRKDFYDQLIEKALTNHNERRLWDYLKLNTITYRLILHQMIRK